MKLFPALNPQDQPIRIQLGLEPATLPTVAGCLNDNDGHFSSVDNVRLVMEWLSDGTCVTPLTLHGARENKDGLKMVRQLGSLKTYAYPNRWHTGWILKVEQRLNAMPEIAAVLKSNLAYLQMHNSKANQEKLQTSARELLSHMAELEAFNASNLYFGTPFQKRFVMETLNVLDMLFSVVLTQRVRYTAAIDEVCANEIPKEMYNVDELDKVLSRMHQAQLEGFFPHPPTQAKTDGLMDESFFCQCAMAYSAVSGMQIPLAYKQTQFRVFDWAVQRLTRLADTIGEYNIKPKTTNIVNLFRAP